MHVLERHSEQDFDELAHLAARICATPMALVSVVEADRVWFKARVGLDIGEVRRDGAFCSATILGIEPLVVEDARADSRFSSHELAAAGIRFYAGVPILGAEGVAIGALGVLDRAARTITPEQLDALRALAHQATALLEWRRTASALRESEELKTRIIDSSPDCIKVLDLDGHLLSMNAGGMAALEICDFSAVVNSQWVGFWEGGDREAAARAIATAREGGIGRFTGYFPTTTTQTPMWWDVVVSPLRGAGGAVEKLLAVSRDATARARASELVWAVAEGTSLSTGADFFRALVSNLAAALRVPYVLVAECTDSARTHVRTLAFWSRTGLAENIEYALAGTPCQGVIDGEVGCYPDDLQALFPDDTPLVAMKARGYLGLPVLNGAGEVAGHLVVIDDKPLPKDEMTTALLRTFAARVGVELERVRTARHIESLGQKLSMAAERARSLLAINNAVVLNLTQDALFSAITDALRRVVAFDRCTIFLHDPQKNVLRMTSSDSAVPSHHFVPGLELPLDGSHAGWAFVNQRVFFNPELRERRTYPGEDVLLEEGFRSLIVVPMVVRGRSIGTLNLGSRRPMEFGDTEAELLQEAANQVALSIENMREYEEIGRLKAQLERENVYLQEEILGEHNYEEIVGTSASLGAVVRTIDRVAPTDTTVLIIGETGTGKELIARAVHNRSARRSRPLVKVNCGAIASGLIESELFGHVKGAFTGALERRTGRFELADRGTLFLDEIGELPLDMQVKLLRVLQEQEFEPVGSSRTMKVDVRVIAATNRNLQEEVAAGRFRADLYYRLNVLPIQVPPLRERREDVTQLAMFFVQKHAKRIGRTVDGVSRESLDRLSAYSWPGNVRELENVIERALVLSHGGVLDAAQGLMPSDSAPAAASSPGPVVTVARGASAAGRLDDVERAHIAATLNQTGWVIEGPRGAAKVLDMHPNTLRSRMKRLGLERPTK
ncbi:MAG TPA: sigma 54-interacting transcriptional regulator [Vicinamibacterales bacterium]|jgi:formate hydrogenlyase transcriptional activator|nr:sigma 54-interacting transcriptional regulator [Vicinamibacterales bacterium]